MYQTYLDTLYLEDTGLTKYTKQAIFLQVYCVSYIAILKLF